MIRTKWTERTFSFDFPEGWMFNIIERLHGTEPRLSMLIENLEEDNLRRKPEGQWSIKEHIGHLTDLEELHEGRLDDFMAGIPVLRAADMTNAKTEAASHNNRDVITLVREFSVKREQFIEKLRSLPDATLLSKAMHPRLQVPMRPVDVAYFTAEHDDHHLASIRALKEAYTLR